MEGFARAHHAREKARRKAEAPAPGTTCAAFLLCGRPATTWLIPEATPPGFDRVPACDRCAEKMKRIAGV